MKDLMIDRKFMDLEKLDKSSYDKMVRIFQKLKGLKWFTTNSQIEIE